MFPNCRKDDVIDVRVIEILKDSETIKATTSFDKTEVVIMTNPVESHTFQIELEMSDRYYDEHLEKKVKESFPKF